MKAILLCRTRQGPTPEQIADALRREGYSAFVETQGGGPEISLTVEIRYSPGKMLIIVDFHHDEGDNDYWEWMEELLPDEKDREGIRRFVFISAMDNVDAGAFQAAVNYIQQETNAIVIAPD